MQKDPNQSHLRHTIALVGMMGAGKSSVGAVLAQMLHARIIDLDHEIEVAANMQISEIFNRFGEDFFRERESQVLARLMAGPAVVLSLGGGTFISPQNRTVVADRGVSVWLKVDVAVLWARIKHNHNRPLLNTWDPYQTLQDLYEQRTPSYAQADVVVTCQPDWLIHDTARAVMQTVTAYDCTLLETKDPSL